MDVRCEKCLTIYELDDAKVGDAGLTVKCQECGNLFKVRRKAEEEAPSREVTSDQFGAPTTDHGPAHDPSDAQQQMASGEEEPVTDPLSHEEASPKSDRGWLLRSAATNEIVRFRELTTLQAWIVERKVSREDQISRGGESWKSLGGIAELASFFHVVEQAASVAHASMPGLAVHRANQTGGLDRQQLAAIPTEPHGALNRRTPTFANDDALLEDDRPDHLRHAGQSPLPAIGLAVVVVGVAVGAYLLWPHAPSRGPVAGETVPQLIEQGHTALRLDTDDGFRRSIAALDRAVELDPGALTARVDLAEAHVTWAGYLVDDERSLLQRGGAPGAQAARSLDAEAHAHLDRARRLLEEPAGREAKDSPLLGRAFADLLRLENAPVASIAPYLDRAIQADAHDRQTLYVRGELARREGKTTDALALLSEAAAPDAAGEVLLRASYRFAQLAIASGSREDAARGCAELKSVWATHDRARTLCAPEAVAETVVPKLDASVPAVVDAAVPVAAPTAASPKDAGVPMDYRGLVQNADRLSVNGHSKEARRLYERALELEPRGIAALTGLGYCDLDSERYMQAVDRFNAALAVDPSSGDALLGLGESYKVRGQNAHAIDAYKKYLALHPTGEKTMMAQKNLRELEGKQAKENRETSKPENDTPPVSDKMTIKQEESDDSSDEKSVVKKPNPEPAPDNKRDVKLPRPPLEEPPP